MPPAKLIRRRQIAAKTSSNSTPQDRPKTAQREINFQAIEHLEKYVGPLPPAEDFAAYDMCMPGAGERIFAMAEKEQASRLKIREELAAARIADTRAERREISRAQWLAWSLAVLVLSIGGVLIYTNHPIAGTFITGTTLIGIISAFLNNTSTKKTLSSSSSKNTLPENSSHPTRKNGPNDKYAS